MKVGDRVIVTFQNKNLEATVTEVLGDGECYEVLYDCGHKESFHKSWLKPKETEVEGYNLRPAGGICGNVLTRSKVIETPKGTVVIRGGVLQRGSIGSDDFEELKTYLNGHVTEENVKKWSPWETNGGYRWFNRDYFIAGLGLLGYVRQDRKNPRDLHYFSSSEEAKSSVRIEHP